MNPARISPERWHEIKQLLESALELKADDRRAFLDKACAGDEALRREVDSFLVAHEQADDFLGKPAFEEVARMLAREESVRNTPGLDEGSTRERQRDPFQTSPIPLELRPPASPRGRWLPLAAVVIVALLAAAVGTIAWLRLARAMDGTPAVTGAKPPAALELSLSYSLEAQKNPKRYPGGQPSTPPVDGVFKTGDQVRLRVSSPQSGYLYIINEGPERTNGLPDFVVMFPNVGDSAQIAANQTIQIPAPSRKPDEDWFVFNEEVGLEKIWLIWSARSVAEIEAIKYVANPIDKGVISDPSRIRAMAQCLAKLAETRVEVEKDGASQQTRLKGNGNVLAGVVRLEHH